ncbi:protein-disulfide reductase DsbD domain-containing protein, partial [Acinetobacter baumannii]
DGVGPWVKAGQVEARLVSAVRGTGDLTALPLGLELRLEPGWKTYWRSPGDAGFAPRLDWSGSGNLAGATLSYPAPHR